METAMPQSPQFRHRVDPSGCILFGGMCRDGKKLDGAIAEVIEETKMPRKYHTIDTCDKAEVIAHLIKDYGVPREQVLRWFGISERTLRWYLKLGLWVALNAASSVGILDILKVVSPDAVAQLLSFFQVDQEAILFFGNILLSFSFVLPDVVHEVDLSLSIV